VDLVPGKAVTLTARKQAEAVRTIASMKIAGAAPLRFPMGQAGSTILSGSRRMSELTIG
jgi:hypothetical protein